MKKILITVVAVLVASVSFAQTNHRFSQVYSFGWQTSVPLGAQADFISRAGFNGEIRSGLTSFEQKPVIMNF